MDNDKVFAAYTLTLVTGLATVLALALWTGVAKAPPPLMFLEHLALGLAIRGAYKAFGGFDSSDWIPAFRTAPALPLAPSVPLEAAPAAELAEEERLAA